MQQSDMNHLPALCGSTLSQGLQHNLWKKGKQDSHLSMDGLSTKALVKIVYYK